MNKKNVTLACTVHVAAIDTKKYLKRMGDRANTGDIEGRDELLGGWWLWLWTRQGCYHRLA